MSFTEWDQLCKQLRTLSDGGSVEASKLLFRMSKQAGAPKRKKTDVEREAAELETKRRRRRDEGIVVPADFHFNIADLFAGIGSAHVAADALDHMRVTLASEIEPVPRATYQRNHGLQPRGDVTALSAADFDGIDIVVAGFPCQPFSPTGKQQGTADPRGRLFPAVMRIIDAMPRKPSAIVLENVPALKTSKKFASVWEAFQRTLRESGYGVMSKVLLASDYGLPQNRTRLFVVALLGSEPPATMLDFPLAQVNLTSFLNNGLDYYRDYSLTIRGGSKKGPSGRGDQIWTRHNWQKNRARPVNAARTLRQPVPFDLRTAQVSFARAKGLRITPPRGKATIPVLLDNPNVPAAIKNDLRLWQRSIEPESTAEDDEGEEEPKEGEKARLRAVDGIVALEFPQESSLTVSEGLRLQGFPRNFVLLARPNATPTQMEQDHWAMVGNSIPTNLSKLVLGAVRDELLAQRFGTPRPQPSTGRAGDAPRDVAAESLDAEEPCPL